MQQPLKGSFQKYSPWALVTAVPSAAVSAWRRWRKENTHPLSRNTQQPKIWFNCQQILQDNFQPDQASAKPKCDFCKVLFVAESQREAEAILKAWVMDKYRVDYVHCITSWVPCIQIHILEYNWFQNFAFQWKDLLYVLLDSREWNCSFLVTWR